MITLVLGGVRSGKSEVAERLAGPGPGTYLATALVAPDDDDFAARVARHRARRPDAWATVEEPRAVPAVLARLRGPVLVDALGTWVANDLRPDLDALVDALVARPGDTIIVSEEVGLGVHPMTEAGRAFADRLGEANRRVAEVADRCLLVVAGRVLELPTAVPLAGVPLAGDPVAGDAVGPSPQPAPAGPNPFAPPPAAPTPGPTPHTPPPTAPTPGPTAFARGTVGAAAGGLRQAVAFLTPVGGAAGPTPAALVWFPLVGALLGLVLGALWWGTADWLGPLAAAALVVAADLALTGALHFDGLVDAADGLLPHLPRERRLAVMADPHVGAFGVATGAAAVLLRTAALAALGTARPLLLAALWATSRTAMAVTAMAGRYARAHGLASSFLPPESPSPFPGRWRAPATAGSAGPAVPPAAPSSSPGGSPAPATAGPAVPPAAPSSSPGGSPAPATAGPAAPAAPPAAPSPSIPPWALTAGIGTLLAVALAIADDPRSLLAVVASGLGAAGVAGLAHRRIGGFTGDTLGASGFVAETAGLLIGLAVHA